MLKLSIKYILYIFTLLPAIALAQSATLGDCSATLKSDTLTVENSQIAQRWLWNGGNLITLSIYDKVNQRNLDVEPISDTYFGDNNKFVENISLKIEAKGATIYHPESVEVTFENRYETFQLKRVVRILPNTPAISFDYAFRYKNMERAITEPITLDNGVEDKFYQLNIDENPQVLRYNFNHIHWKYSYVEFKDATDQNDYLVLKSSVMPYKVLRRYCGNILFAENMVDHFALFILKESPNTTSQVGYPSYDFALTNRSISLPLSGLEKSDSGECYINSYTLTLGLCDELSSGRISLNRYLKNSSLYSAESSEMVLMNTWGDRGRDGRLSEEFVKEEIKKASQLGVSHFQIDDGWQQELSKNSATKGSTSQWDSWSDEAWHPHRDRFPNGLKPIVDFAKKKGVAMGLWFNPSSVNDYATWERDANTVIDLYREWGIRYFKIDGVAIPTKQAAINFELFMEKIKRESNGEVFFNLDCTAGIRGGYFSYRYAGNIFVENRYTDWVNYYPFHTLRNLWMLSEYMPSETLQFEFLNIWRNSDLYTDGDIFAPSNYTFDYVFAITMAAQPLAWFEAANLPEEAFATSKLIKIYRKHQAQLHAGVILPIGQEPDGRSWCGFQSMSDGGDGESGYFIIYRENNNTPTQSIKSYLAPDSRVRLTHLAGDGEDTTVQVDAEGEVEFRIDDINNFSFYRYEVID